MEDLLNVATERVERHAEENRRILDVIQRERRRLFQGGNNNRNPSIVE
jgi:hypothetical protein